MVTENQKRSRNKWDAANMTVLGCKVRKDKAEAFKAACAAAGTTVNAVFSAAIDDFMLRTSGDPGQATHGGMEGQAPGRG